MPVAQKARQVCSERVSVSEASGPIHTGRARATQANGTCCRQWECSHCDIKEFAFKFACASHPVSCVNEAPSTQDA